MLKALPYEYRFPPNSLDDWQEHQPWLTSLTQKRGRCDAAPLPRALHPAGEPPSARHHEHRRPFDRPARHGAAPATLAASAAASPATGSCVGRRRPGGRLGTGAVAAWVFDKAEYSYILTRMSDTRPRKGRPQLGGSGLAGGADAALPAGPERYSAAATEETPDRESTHRGVRYIDGCGCACSQGDIPGGKWEGPSGYPGATERSLVWNESSVTFP